MPSQRHRRRGLIATASAIALAGVAASTIGFVSATNGGVESTFVPVTPCRLLDTRSGPANVGARSTPLGPGETASLAVHGTNGDCTIPTGATAIATNTTILSPTAPSFLTVFPSDAARPNASNLNWVAGQAPTPNQVTVSLSTDGRVSLFNESGSVDLIVDIVGYFRPAANGSGAGTGTAPVDAYTKSESDARYYTQSQADGRYYTQSQADGRYYTQSQADGRYYTRTEADDRFHLGESVVLVPADGTPAENGAALEAALASISGAGPDSPFVVQLAPGVYDVGADGTSTVAHVHLRGAGPGTIVTAPGSDDDDDATIRLGDDAIVSDLTVRNTGGSTQYALALAGHGDRWSVRDARVEVTGGSFFPSGFVGRSGAGPGELRDVHVEVDGFGTASGLGRTGASSSTLAELTIRGSTIRLPQGGTGIADVGLTFNGTLRVTDTVIEVLGGGTGVATSDGDRQLYRSVDVRVSGGTGANRGFGDAGSGFTPRIENSRIEVDGTAESAGVRTNNGSIRITGSIVAAPRAVSFYATGSFSGAVRIDHSTLEGTTGIHSEGNDHTIRIGATKVDAPALADIESGSPTFTCLGSYDASYQALGSPC